MKVNDVNDICLEGKNIHFMGAGGIGVSALALLSVRLGAKVSGCDKAKNQQTEFLSKSNIAVHKGHDVSHLDAVDILVHTSAVKKGHNEELDAAIKSGIQVFKRGDFLAVLLGSYKQVIGICGTHGKTTTTWFVGKLFVELGFDSTIILGGVPQGEKANVFIGGNDICIVELDESDASFLLPDIDVAVITNIEPDHLDFYGDEKSLYNAFEEFAGKVSKSGKLVIATDSDLCKKIFTSHHGEKYSVCSDENNSLRVISAKTKKYNQEIVFSQNSEKYSVFLKMPGYHNVKNMLCAVGTIAAFGVSIKDVVPQIEKLTPVERRFELLSEKNGITIIRDYAHHPTEIKVAVETAKSLECRRVVAVFQPHLFSRTQFFFRDFAEAISGADYVFLMDIYPAREKPIEGVTSGLIKSVLAENNRKVSGPFSKTDIANYLKDVIKDGDVILFLGAGDIGELAYEFVAEL